MRFEFTGHPSTSPLWTNPAPRRTAATGWGAWINYGGDKLWPSPQDTWPIYTGDIIPDPAFDSGPYAIYHIHNGVRLVGPISRHYAVQVTREIVLIPGESAVRIRDTYSRSTGATDSLRIALWNVSQLRPDAIGYVPVDSKALETKPYTSLIGPPILPNCTVRSGFVVVARMPRPGTKVGIRSKGGWISALTGDVLLTQDFADPAGAVYIDHGVNAEFWTNTEPGYLEMELQSPYRRLRAGHSMSRTVIWALTRLKLGKHCSTGQTDRLVRQAGTRLHGRYARYLRNEKGS